MKALIDRLEEAAVALHDECETRAEADIENARAQAYDEAVKLVREERDRIVVELYTMLADADRAASKALRRDDHAGHDVLDTEARALSAAIAVVTGKSRGPFRTMPPSPDEAEAECPCPSCDGRGVYEERNGPHCRTLPCPDCQDDDGPTGPDLEAWDDDRPGWSSTDDQHYPPDFRH